MSISSILENLEATADDVLTTANDLVRRIERIEGSIYSGSGAGLVINSAALAQHIRSTNFVTGSTGWNIDKSGDAEFNDVTVRGTIYASAGDITGTLYVGETSGRIVIDGSAKTIGSENYSAGTTGWQIDGTGAAEFNSITARGTIYASAGAFTGTVTVGSSGGTIDIDGSAKTIGSSNFSTGSAGWQISYDGSAEFNNITASGLVVTTADITGTVYVGETSSRIVIDGAAKTIGSEDYVSGSTGWQIDGSGNAEFLNITARGQLGATSFKDDAISSVGGIMMVAPSSVLAADIAIGGTTLTVADASFADGDFLALKEAGNFEVMTVSSGGGTTTLTVSRATGGAAAAWKTGTAVVRYGDRIVLDTVSSNTPYMDVVDYTGPLYTNATTAVRVGNLDGISDPNFNPSGYGIYSTNAYFSGLGIFGDVELNSGGVKLVGDYNTTTEPTNIVVYSDIQGQNIANFYGYYYTVGDRVKTGINSQHFVQGEATLTLGTLSTDGAGDAYPANTTIYSKSNKTADSNEFYISSSPYSDMSSWLLLNAYGTGGDYAESKLSSRTASNSVALIAYTNKLATTQYIDFFVPEGYLKTAEFRVSQDGILVNGGQEITEFSTDGTMGGNSDLALPTEKAVKTYADGKITTLLAANNVWTGTQTIQNSVVIGTGAHYLQLNAGTQVTEFSTDGTFGGNSDVALPTEKAAKTYVDTAISALHTTHTFLAGTDTPANYTGSGGKLVAVNSGETALEFITHTPLPDPDTYWYWNTTSSTWTKVASTTVTTATLEGLGADSIVLFGEGTFTLDAVLDVTSNLMIKGQGWNYSLLVGACTVTTAYLDIRELNWTDSGARNLFDLNTSAGLHIVDVEIAAANATYNTVNVDGTSTLWSRSSHILHSNAGGTVISSTGTVISLFSHIIGTVSYSGTYNVHPNSPQIQVDATGFSGNLSGTDDDLQTALETIDALTLGSGGASPDDVYGGNLLKNFPTVEDNDGGQPVGWYEEDTNVTLTEEDTAGESIPEKHKRVFKVVNGAAGASKYVYQQLTVADEDLLDAGQTVLSGGVWVYTASAGTVTVALVGDVAGSLGTGTTTTTSTWTWIAVENKTLGASDTTLDFRVSHSANSATLYFCMPMLNVGSTVQPWEPREMSTIDLDGWILKDYASDEVTTDVTVTAVDPSWTNVMSTSIYAEPGDLLNIHALIAGAVSVGTSSDGYGRVSVTDPSTNVNYYYGLRNYSTGGGNIGAGTQLNEMQKVDEAGTWTIAVDCAVRTASTGSFLITAATAPTRNAGRLRVERLVRPRAVNVRHFDSGQWAMVESTTNEKSDDYSNATTSYTTLHAAQTITLKAGEKLRINYDAVVAATRTSALTSGGARVRLNLDSGTYIYLGLHSYFDESTGTITRSIYDTVSYDHFIEGLSAGSHTVSVEANVLSGSSTVFCSASSSPTLYRSTLTLERWAQVEVPVMEHGEVLADYTAKWNKTTQQTGLSSMQTVTWTAEAANSTQGLVTESGGTFTIQKAGVYTIDSNMFIYPTGGAGTTLLGQLYYNSSDAIGEDRRTNYSNTSPQVVQPSTHMEFAVGDTIVFRGFCSTTWTVGPSAATDKCWITFKYEGPRQSDVDFPVITAPPTSKYERTTSQTGIAGGWASIDWSGVSPTTPTGTGAPVAVDTTTTLINILQTGLYTISGKVVPDATSGNDTRVGGGLYIPTATNPYDWVFIVDKPSTTSATHVPFSHTIWLTAGDQIGISGYSNATTWQFLYAAGTNANHVTIVYHGG